jgi:hypothetical protein
MTRIDTLALIGLFAAACSTIVGATGQDQAPPGAPFADPPEAIVKGAPYSGEATTIVKLTMFDGTKMEQSVSARIFRDSAGRIRREQSLMGLDALDPSGGSNAIVLIVDPVAQVIYTLIPGSKTAMKLPMTGPQTPPPPPPASGDAKVTSLGTRFIDGLNAVGTRTVTTIPAGRMGNDRPIEIVDERWDSSELKVILRSTHHDPRSGDVEYTLTRIVRTEPAAELFALPKGYIIRDSEKSEVRSQKQAEGQDRP